MMTHQFPTLYDHRQRYWKIYISVDKLGRGFIGTEYGGKRPKPRQIKYKHPLTPKEMYQKIYQLAETKWINKQRSLVSAVSPMLAHDYSKYSHRITFPAYVQVKYDGYRALADLSQGVLLTRRMNTIPNVEHITQELQQIKATTGIYLDGELYLKDGLYQLKTALADRGASAKRPLYRVFDMFDLNQMEMGFEERWARLTELLKANKYKYRYVKLVETYKVKTSSEVEKYLKKFLNLGHEGLVVRNAAGVYKLRGKSMDVQKLVEVKRGLFEIVGYKAAEGNQVVWVLKCQKTADTFCASPMGTHAYRRELLKHAKDYVGQKVTVKYFELDGDGCVIRHPIVEMPKNLLR